MADFKVVISDPKSGKSVQKELKADNAKNIVGLKIGDVFKGEIIELTGYEFQITGGSDYCGFPMRKDVEGTARKRILAIKGIGITNKKKARGKDMKYMRTMKGMRQRKSVAGNTIYDKTAQINVKIVKYGKENLFPEKAAEKPAEAPKEGEAKPAAEPKPEAKQAPKAEAKAEEKKPKQKPAEAKKAEAAPKAKEAKAGKKAEKKKD